MRIALFFRIRRVVKISALIIEGLEIICELLF